MCKSMSNFLSVTTNMTETSPIIMKSNNLHAAVTNVDIIITGADPGIFVRGVQLSENFDKQKKKKKKRRRENGRRVVVVLSLIYIQVSFQ